MLVDLWDLATAVAANDREVPNFKERRSRLEQMNLEQVVLPRVDIGGEATV